MAPMRGDRCGSPAKGARASLPLPRRLIKQIAKHVASSGRSLRRLEVSGRVIENFDDIDSMSGDDDRNTPITAAACGGRSGNLPPPDDDELTSLSWLQDKNLLRGTLGINLTKTDELPEEDDEMRLYFKTPCWHAPSGQVRTRPRILCRAGRATPSPPSPSQLATPPPPSTPTPPPTPPTPPPSLSTLLKPPYSFSSLIFMAIESAPARALPVKDIYAWILRHFPYFKNAPQGWKNSVRHNLSLSKCFHKAFVRRPIPKHEWRRDVGLCTRSEPHPFPFLAQRLAGEATQTLLAKVVAPKVASPPPPTPPPPPTTPTPPTLQLGADEYRAAATVLTMKYGPSVVDQIPPAYLVISRCTGDEHSYSGGAERRIAEALLDLAAARAPR